MSNTVRGTKRHCRNCGAKFYDLNHDPITCPVCQTVYELEPSAARAAATAAAAAAAAAAARPAAAAEEEEEEVVATAAGEPEFVSLEEADAGSTDTPPEEDEEIAEIADVEEEIPESEDDEGDVFLEDDEEEGSDVSGFIGGGLASDEER